MQMVAFKSDNATQTGANFYGPAVNSPPVGQELDIVGILKPPSDAAYLALRPSLNFMPNVQTADIDLDAVAMFDLGPNYTGGTEAATNPADVPAYFDGDTPGKSWSGTAHSSTSKSPTTTTIADAILANSVIPAGIKWTYQTVAGWIYAVQTAEGVTYAANVGRWASYAAQSAN